MSKPVLSERNYILDTSTSSAFSEIVESAWDFNVYSSQRSYVMNCGADTIFDYFAQKFPELQYRVFFGRVAFFWNDKLSIKFNGEFHQPKSIVNAKFDDDIIVSGHKELVKQVVDDFDDDFNEKIVPDHHVVDMIIKSSHGGLDRISLPVKTDRKFYPELYPVIADPIQFITDYITSSSNVLILTGPAGLGKSAFINELILRARVPTEIVFDPDIMRTDTLYTNFINRSLSENGRLMIMEDADLILNDRQTAANDMMSRLLNLSDGIVNTSGAKFIFSANLKSKSEIDEALIRPGRCFDVVEFRNLTYEEALKASEAVGVELYAEKDEYTVAEIFNKTHNRKIKRKVGFI